MFRLLGRFGIGSIARKVRIPLEDRIGRLPVPNLCRMYRRLATPCDSITFKAENIDCDIDHDERDELSEHELPKWIMTEIMANIASVIQSQENEIDWDKVISNSMKAVRPHLLEREVIKGYIVKACEMEKLNSQLVSYFEYLIKNNEVCAGMLYLFCDATARNPEELSKCLDIIYEIWKKLLPEQDIARVVCMSILMTSKKYSTVLSEKHARISNFGGFEFYFDNGDIDGALKSLNTAPGEKVFNALHHFMNYFATCASVGEIPISKFVTFFDALSNRNISLSNELIQLVTDLVLKMDKCDKTYTWSCKESDIGDYCKFCSGKLNKVDISQEEIELLKAEIEKNVIHGHNINIKSTRQEWNSFLAYINRKPYDIVLDGLNIWYACLRDPNIFSTILQFIEKKELIPLIVARKHFTSSSAYYMIQRKYPFFLAADLSHDDVFVMYAALNKGKDCYFVTNDQMGFAKNSVGARDFEDMYMRWQASHQCCINKYKLVFPHGVALGTQKSPSADQEEFRYHVVAKDLHSRKMYCISRLRR